MSHDFFLADAFADQFQEELVLDWDLVRLLRMERRDLILDRVENELRASGLIR